MLITTSGISEAITDHDVMTLIAHRNTISVCLMCSGQIIYKPREKFNM